VFIVSCVGLRKRIWILQTFKILKKNIRLILKYHVKKEQSRIFPFSDPASLKDGLIDFSRHLS
jgi:hypothetical protein